MKKKNKKESLEIYKLQEGEHTIRFLEPEFKLPVHWNQVLKLGINKFKVVDYDSDCPLCKLEYEVIMRTIEKKINESIKSMKHYLK